MIMARNGSHMAKTGHDHENHRDGGRFFMIAKDL
jgi:hypothetical protein